MTLMNEIPNDLTSRREFLKDTGRFAAVSALAGVALPHVHAAENNTIQVALIGCGGRGGFAAYQKAMDCLKPGDVAIFATPLAFRWVHFTYAIQKKLNVFMEKPLTADGPTSRRMLDLAKEASAKNLKVGVGLMSRHARHLQELHKRVQDGEIGDVMLMRGYRMHGAVAS